MKAVYDTAKHMRVIATSRMRCGATTRALWSSGSAFWKRDNDSRSIGPTSTRDRVVLRNRVRGADLEVAAGARLALLDGYHDGLAEHVGVVGGGRRDFER